MNLEYLKGVLNTYAHLNMPNSNLVYEYQIIEFEKSQEANEALIENFGHTICYANEIDERYFKSKIKEWLFNNGELRKINLSEYRKTNEANSVFGAINLATNPIIFKTCILNEDKWIGAHYDFFLIEGKKKNYILSFLYSD